VRRKLNLPEIQDCFTGPRIYFHFNIDVCTENHWAVCFLLFSKRKLKKRVADFTYAFYPKKRVLLLRKQLQKYSFQFLTQALQQHKKRVTLPEETNTYIPESAVCLLNIPLHVKVTLFSSLILSPDSNHRFSKDKNDLVAKLADQIGITLQGYRQAGYSNADHRQTEIPQRL